MFRRFVLPGCAGLLLVPAIVSGARATAVWRNSEAGSAVDSALYRWMPMPVTKVLGLRPPKEATPLISKLLEQKPTAELYSLRALNEEAALDFAAAEADWKKYVESSQDHVDAQWSLADFYHRRLRPADEVAALAVIGHAPDIAVEKRVAPEERRSWRAFERIFKVIGENALPSDLAARSYREWIARYPDRTKVYDRYLQFLLDHKSYGEAENLIAQYRSAMPKGDVFPVKARALIEYCKGSVEQGLAVYDKQFQPLWPQELIDSYFGLLKQTRSVRKFLDSARAEAERDPVSLNAAARIFYYYQRQGRTDAAQLALTQFRQRKEKRDARWTSQELITLAKLNLGIRDYPEAARYYYALYSTNAGVDAQEVALAGIVNVLLEAPEQNEQIGTGDLSMYRDIATMDRGPGFLNGILSLILNTTAPAYAYSEEERRATPYFHRAEAAQLIRLFESRFPKSVMRAGLRSRLIQTYAAYGESGAVIRDGQQFLKDFPSDSERESVAMLLADAYAREHQTENEFSLYDAELAELGKRLDGVPLGMKSNSPPAVNVHEENESSPIDDENGGSAARRANFSRAFATQTAASTPEKNAQAWYSDYLERYLSRLASLQQLPQALAVLRREVDRNPNDAGLYERLALFLEQNRLGQQEEEVYQRAIQKFPDRSWYHKLARLYLRNKRNADFARLSEQVIQTFSGTELESYFSDVVSGREYYTRLNEFAAKRFPHDLMFVRNLLQAYRKPQPEQWESLLRQHWWEAEDLRNQFFEYLSRTGKLGAELDQLQAMESAAQGRHWNELASANPVAARLVGEARLWSSHIEEAAPVMTSLAGIYPADAELGQRASAVNRSLAAFDPERTETAIKIEQNLYAAEPTNRETLARLGDVLGDRQLFGRAATYWNRMAQVRPGEPEAYLQAATVYWDYFDYDSALKLLDEGRRKLADATLYSFEEGAIFESKQEYPRAIREYVNGALKEHEGSRPHNRLLELARRKATREDVDRATAQVIEGASPAIEAIKLRIAVLDSQNRNKDVEALLLSVGERSSSLETLEWLEEIARQRSLSTVQERVLERQAAVTSDPVRKLELRYSLVQFYDARKDAARAQRNIEALYAENPKILGVVRSTVDFFWKNKARQRAVEVLLQAANNSYPELRLQFQLEAAQKASEAGEYELSRRLARELLAQSPYDERYLSVMADAYSRQRDDVGLKKFSLEKIEEIRKAPLAQDEKTRRIAALRRGLIPALTRMKDYAGAVDQYIEIINRYPEDDALLSDAALYAQRNGRQQQLLQYYERAITQSPKDYRWPMALAKIETLLEHYPAAIDAYATAIKVRPDRADLRLARAGLLERLMRFSDAESEYQQLYELNYHDAQYMEKVAELRARQGRTNEAVAAVGTALIDKRPEKASNYFEAAKRLERWGMVEQAKAMAQKGADVAGRDLLAVADNHEGAKIYAALMTRLRQQDAAYATLDAAVKNADSLAAEVSVAVKQVENNGIASVTDKQWRARAIEVRRTTARSGMQAAMVAMGSAANQYFTPEEKVRFGAWLESASVKASGGELATRFVPAATAAGLGDLQARWLKQLMLLNAPHSNMYKASLSDLQKKRMRFDELGAALEEYAAKLNPQQGRLGVLEEAAKTYQAGALYDSEFNVLRKIGVSSVSLQQRYFELLLQRSPQEVVQLASSSRSGLGDAACQYLVAHGSYALAQQAVSAHGRALDPVWTKSYTALTGLYFAERGAIVGAAFHDALGDQTIGERLGRPVVRSEQLAGSLWFYYASRYGEWLELSHSADAEDFLPAQLEQSPASASGYVTLGEYYADAGKVGGAIDEYKHAIELAPSRADLHDRIAVLYWRQQRREEALAEWRTSLELLDSKVHQRVVPADFWSTFSLVMNHVGVRHVTAQLRPKIDGVLQSYVRQNGTYQVEGLLRAFFVASSSDQVAVSYMLELASLSPEPTSFLELLAEAKWIPRNLRTPIYEQLIARLQQQTSGTQTTSNVYEDDKLRSWQDRFALYLVELQQYDRAASVLPARTDEPTETELQVIYRVALANGKFDTLLEQYQSEPDKAPPDAKLREVASALRQAGQRKAARKLLEYVFSHEIAQHQLNAANMLGLAEIRLQDGDTGGAVELLRRLVLAVGQPFEYLNAAGSLLARNGQHAQAVEFLSKQVEAMPWDRAAGVQLAQEQIAAGQDVAGARVRVSQLAGDSQTTYATRLTTASLAGPSAQELGSGELNFVARGTGAADGAYFTTARVLAAKKVSDSKEAIRLLRSAIADAPQDRSVRLILFDILNASKQDRLAISSIEPLLQAGFIESGYIAPSAPAEESGEETGADEHEGTIAKGEEFAAKPDRTDLPNRAALAVKVARSYAEIGNFDTSLRYYRAALKMKLARETRSEVTAATNQLKATMTRNANNARRMPLIHRQIEQSQLVRPRLFAESRPSAKAAAAKGGQAQ